MSSSMQSVGLFAGIGGIELGFERAGFYTAMLVENEPTASHVLRTRFPEAKLHSDVRDLRELPPSTDLLTAGFPCQDLSSVGRKSGITGSRSGLVGEVFRLLARQRVPWVVLENVPFLLHLDKGNALRLVTEELQSLGYRWAYRVVDAASFGLPQRRRRWFLVASLDHDPRTVLFADEAGAPPSPAEEPCAFGFYWTEGTRALGWAPDAVPPLKCGSSVGVPSPPAIIRSDKRIVLPDIRDAERLQGFDADWTKPAEDVGRPSLRWRLVGNAVSVRAAEWLGRRVANPGEVLGSDADAVATGARWPNAAWFDGTTIRRATLSEFPERHSAVPIERFLEYPTKPLSVRAASGFLARAEKGSLRFAPGFLDAVRDHVEWMHAEATGR